MSIDLGVDEGPDVPFEALPPKPAERPAAREPAKAHGSNGVHDPDAELYLLSCLLQWPELFPKALHLKAEMFAGPGTRKLWGALREGLQWPGDLFALEKATGLSRTRLFEVSHLSPSETGLSGFVKTVEEAWRDREYDRVLADMARGGNRDPGHWAKVLAALAEGRAATEPVPLSSFAFPEDNDRSILLGDRFLNRGDSLVLSSTSGMGKSSLDLQMAATWALGRPFHGIRCNGPLKSLIIQAEDSDGDIAEVWLSIKHAMKLTDAEVALVSERVLIVTERVRRGQGFIDELRRLVARHRPDLVHINPLQSYIEGDVTESRDLGDFLRAGLNSLNEPPTFGYIVVHHTTKPATGDNRQERLHHEVMYDMAGGAEIINWARAIMSLRATDTPGDYNLVLAKRGPRAGVTKEVEAGAGVRDEIVTTVPIKHSTDLIEIPGRKKRLRCIFWESREASASSTSSTTKNGRPPTHQFSTFRPVFPKTQAEAAQFSALRRLCIPIRPIGNNALARMIDDALADGILKCDNSDPGHPKYWVAQ